MEFETQARFRQVFTVEDEQARGALATYERATKSAEAASEKLKSVLGKLFAAAAAGFTIRGLHAITQESIQSVRQFRDLSLAMGGTIEQAAVMSDVFQSAGVGIEAANEALSKWGMAQAQLKRLKPGESLSAELRAWEPLLSGDYASAFVKIGERVKSARSETERLAIATSYFGEAGRKFLPVLMESQKTLQNIASGTGAGYFNRDTFDTLDNSRRQLAAIDQEWAQIKVKVAREVAPPLIDMAVKWLPRIKSGAEVVAEALGAVAQHADHIVFAIKAAAAGWATMKIANSVSNFAMMARYSAQIAAASKVAAEASAVSAGAGAFAAFSGKLPAFSMTGPTSALAGATAGATAGAAGTGLLSRIGAGLGSRLSGVARFLGPRLPGLGLFGLGAMGYGIWNAWSDENAAESGSRLPTHLRRAASQMGRRINTDSVAEAIEAAKREIRANEEAIASERHRAEVQERATKALERFEAMTGFGSEQLKALGVDVERLGRQMASGALAMTKAAQRFATQQADQDRQKADFDTKVTQGAAWFAGQARAQGDPLAWLKEQRRAQERILEAGSDYIPSGGEGGRFGKSVALTKERQRQIRQQIADVDLAVATIRKQQAEAVAAGQRAILDGTSVQVTNNFNGPMRVEVNAKDQDPDRIMFSILEDVARLSAHRTTARTYPVFAGR